MKSCENCRYRKIDEKALPCCACIDLGQDLSGWVGITNADRIRGMSDEELADFIAEFMYCKKCWKYDKENLVCTRTSGCNSAMLEWLKQESEVE